MVKGCRRGCFKFMIGTAAKETEMKVETEKSVFISMTLSGFSLNFKGGAPSCLNCIDDANSIR